MSLKEIFSDSIRYPFSDVSKFVIIGILALIASMSGILTNYTVDGAVMSIAGVISFIAALTVNGYGVSVIKSGIDMSADVPGLDFVNNIVDGVKVLIINFIYFIIPLVIVLILAGLSTMGLLVDEKVFLGLGVTVIIAAVILYILFAIMAYVAVARFASTGEFSDALALRDVFGDVKRIGILKIIGFVILLFVLMIVVLAVMGIIGLIPYVGMVISSFVGAAFLVFLSNRALGLLYADS